jgi:glycosyltransferase involved in cell wall biosynthesis
MELRIMQVDTERGWRGGQRQTLLVARELARLGHRCFVAAWPGEPLAERAAAAGLDVIPVRPRSELALGSALALRKVIQRERIQIVHAQAAHAVALAALATIGTKARVVVTRHLARRLQNNLGTRWKYGRASAVLAVSQAAANALVASGISPDRIEVVHGGVETRRNVIPASRGALSRFGIPLDAPLAMMVGALVPQKDPLTFVRAIATAHREVPALHALLVGDGELRAKIEEEARSLGIGDVVHLAGFQREADPLLAAADVAVLSSVFEGLPLVIMDAFVLGVPVAATAGEGIPELVTDGATGLLVPIHDHQALGRAIARIIGDPVLAKRLCDGARERVADFSIERTVTRTLAVYERTVARRPPAGVDTTRRTDAATRARSPSSTRAP